MVETIQKKLSDSPKARWTAVLIVAFTMMMGYFFTDVMSPLASMLKDNTVNGGMGWSGIEYGFFSGSYGFINVFLLMLFFGGLILDKMGIRFTGIMACSLMVAGAFIKFYAIEFISPAHNLAIFGIEYKVQVWIAALGFAIFGVGCEICGITVSKVIAKWFDGYSMALAMGIQVGMARVGTGVAVFFSPIIAKSFQNLGAPILLGAALLSIGLVSFIIYSFMDKKLDDSTKNIQKADTAEKSADDEGFKFSDLGAIFTNPGFWLITLLCLLFYSGVFPFLKYASELMVAKYGIDPEFAGKVPSILPFGTIVMTPLFGTLYDRVGKGATLMLIGSLLMTLVHIGFALPIFTSVPFAVSLMVLLGVAFALVPSAMWPSVPKIIPLKQLGSAYAIIFYIQNIGLSLVPIFIGKVLDASSVNGTVDFTNAMWIFASFGIISVCLAFILRILDSKKHYGLEQANIKK